MASNYRVRVKDKEDICLDAFVICSMQADSNTVHLTAIMTLPIALLPEHL